MDIYVHTIIPSYSTHHIDDLEERWTVPLCYRWWLHAGENIWPIMKICTSTVWLKILQRLMELIPDHLQYIHTYLSDRIMENSTAVEPVEKHTTRLHNLSDSMGDLGTTCFW